MFSLLTCFIVEVLGDYFSCLWHHARESERLIIMIVISMLLQALTWIPVGLAIETGNTFAIACVSVVGTGVGTLFGALHTRRAK